MKSAPGWVLYVLLLIIVTIAPAQTPFAAEPTESALTTANPTLRQVLEQEKKWQAQEQQTRALMRKHGALRATPRAALANLSTLLDADDYETAAEWLDLRHPAKGISSSDGPQLIEHLRYIFTRHVWLDITSLSDDPEGLLDDSLPRNRDAFGTIETSNGAVELYLQRIPDGKGGQEWKISSSTVAQVPGLWNEFGRSEFANRISRRLPAWHWLGIDNWQWAYLLLFIACLAAAVYLLSFLLGRLAKRSDARWISVAQNFVTGPLGIFVYITVLRIFMLSLGLSVIARAIFDSVLLVYLAYIFLALGIVNFFANYTRRHMVRSGRPEAVSMVRPISAIIKIVLVAIVSITGLNDAGYNVATIVTGLGIGSIAVALAAQKTLENLIGAITLYVTRAVQPGDFCRFGDTVGTVEEIGLRSTLLRTLDRTVVNIPNAVFAGGQIENISARESIRYYRMIDLRLATTPDHLRFILARLRELLYAHPAIVSDSISVRLFNIDDHAYRVRMDSRVISNDFQQYLAIAEDINLRIIDLVHQSGTNFAYPSQTIMVEDAARLDAAQKQRVENLVAQWREQDRLPFPQWSDEYVNQIENTLEFPPGGSPGNPRYTKDSDANER